MNGTRVKFVRVLSQRLVLVYVATSRVPASACLAVYVPKDQGRIYPAVTPARPLSGDLAPRVGVGGAFPARSTPVRRVRRRSCPPPRMA